MWATVGKHRQAQGQARQAQSRRENRYVIKVMRLNRGGDTFPRFARTKEVPIIRIQKAWMHVLVATLCTET